MYKQDGTLLFRVDMGYNVRAANDHETTLFAEDFDGDGKSELMLKTALGTRIGNWDEASQSVVYPDSGVVGGEDGLNSTTDKFKEYFATRRRAGPRHLLVAPQQLQHLVPQPDSGRRQRRTQRPER